LYDEGSDVAREVVSEVEINKMGISKKEVKEQFARGENKSDRAVEFLPIHIFFHICSTKIPYKTAGKESIASENELKRYMKSCLAELYRKVSAQIRKELRMKEAESKLRLYKHYIPLIISAISESIRVDTRKLSEAFSQLAEKHVKGEILGLTISEKHDKITGKRIDSEADRSSKTANAALQVSVSDSEREPEAKKRTKNNEDRVGKPRSLGTRNSQKKNQTTLDVFYRGTKRRKK
jgi:DNA topoisomerase-6 subunit B